MTCPRCEHEHELEDRCGVAVEETWEEGEKRVWCCDCTEEEPKWTKA